MHAHFEFWVGSKIIIKGKYTVKERERERELHS